MTTTVVLPSISIVMPVYNEAENLPSVLPEVLSALRDIYTTGSSGPVGQAPRGEAAFEVVCVNDGSKDASATVLADIAAREPAVRVLTHEQNRGLTAALRTGYYGAQKEWVLFIPADGQIPVTSIRQFLEASPGCDVVLSRYTHRPDGPVRWAMSRGLRVLLYMAIGFGDRLEGPYLFRRKLLDQLDIVAERSAGSIGFEICAKAKAAGSGFHNITIGCEPRRSGKSKVAHLASIREYLGEIWRIRQSMRATRPSGSAHH